MREDLEQILFAQSVEKHDGVETREELRAHAVLEEILALQPFAQRELQLVTHAPVLHYRHRLQGALVSPHGHTIIDGVVNGAGWLGRTLSDILYRYIDAAIDGAVNGAGWLGRTLSDACYRFIDTAIIDAFVNLVGRVGTVIAGFNRWFDTTVVNGTVDLVGNVTTWTGKRLRDVQTGQVQSYLLVAVISILTLVGVYLYGTLRLNW